MLKNKMLNRSVLFIIFIILLFSLTRADEERLRDPFVSLVTEDGRLIVFKQKKQTQLELEGILYDPAGRAAALINSEIVRIGDWVGDYQVYRIEPDKVIFLKDGNEFVIKLEKEER